MSRTIPTTGSIVSPATPPQAGFYESLTFLDGNGYFMDTQNHMTAMARAGLRCVNPRAENSSPIFAVAQHPDGLFNEGVGVLGRDFLQILAYEGFEGEITDLENGKAFILSRGSLKEVLHYDRDPIYGGNDRMAMVA